MKYNHKDSVDERYKDIVKKYYESVRPYFYRRLSKDKRFSGLSIADAEDVYNDAFDAVNENLGKESVRENTSWSNYIMTICMNLACKKLRENIKTVSFDIEVDEYGNEVPSQTAKKVKEKIKQLYDEDSLYEDLESQALLGEELAHTPDPCGKIVRLYYYEGKSMAEIAELVGYKNATTAKSKKSQCMKDLSKRVKDSFRRAGII